MLRKSILVLTITNCVLHNIEASQYYPIVDGEKIKALISANSINRIKFGDSPYVQIIGDETKFSLVLDERGTNLFLTSKVPAGETFDLYLINIAGGVANLNLETGNIGSQFIEIIPLNINKNHTKDNLVEMNLMLNNMIKDRVGKYYVRQTERPIFLKDFTNLRIIQDRTYRYGDVIGARLNVRSLDKKREITINDLNFSKVFKNSKLSSIQNKTIKPGCSTYVWIISIGALSDL